MRWIEVSIKCTEENIDKNCRILEDMGVEGYVIEDERDFREFLENNHQYWDYVDAELEKQYENVCRLKFYLEENADGENKLLEVKKAVDGEVSTNFIEDCDWENNWKEFYKPIAVGDRLMIVPAWEDPELDGRVALRLEPGLTFGTGAHATTRMCLEMIDKMDMAGKRVLDLGCGSGILGIGAAVLGCKEVVGCDIDPKSSDVAVENAAMNGISGENFKIYAGDVISDAGMRKMLGGGYDVVFANIVADVIAPLTPMVRDFMAPGGVYICSGIIEGRQQEIEAVLKKCGFTIVEHRCGDGEWHCYMSV